MKLAKNLAMNLGGLIAELLRMLVMLLLFAFAMNSVETRLYRLFTGGEIGAYWGWTASANLLLFLVLYRNVLQFRGWYRSESMRRFEPRTTRLLTGAALAALVLPAFWIA